MKAYGNVATGAAGQHGVPLPTTPRHSGRSVVTDVERAHTPTWRIPTVEPTPTADLRCAACREYVHDALSQRGWCGWCEEQAALAIAPEPAENIPALIPADPSQQEASVDDEQPVELPDYILDFAVLMRDTEAHDDRDVREARKVVANAAMRLQRIHRTWLGRQAAAKPAPRPATPTATAHRTHRNGGRKTDPAVVDACVRLYLDDTMTIPKIADRLGIGRRTVRVHLISRNVQLRDDRAGHSGGANKRTDDPAFVRQVAELYVAGHSLDEVASRLGTGQRQVRAALTAAGVDVRAAQPRTPRDGAAALKARMQAAGVTTAKVRAWCKVTGRDVPAVGLLPARIVDEYLTEHQRASA